MARPAKQIADALASKALGLSRYVGRVEEQFNAGGLRRADVHRAYAGAFVYFHLHLETAIDDLFMGYLMNRLDLTRGKVRPLVAIKSEMVARRVVRGERRFVDWLPYHYTRERAKMFLSGGGPFERLSGSQEAPLERVRVIRNAIAHASGHAQSQFEKTCLSGLALPPEQRRPAGFLRGQHAVGQSRFDYHVAQAVSVMRHLV